MELERRFMGKRAFTLIEILIVVGIISILALISTANLLEAQIRAKVSRTQADMRSLATAVEAYRTDTNKYPPHNDTPCDLTALSTPVSYITTIPFDIFQSPRNPNWERTGPYYTWQDLWDIHNSRNPDWGGGDWLERRIGEGKMWSLSSPGPDLVVDMANDATAIYDPSNGTISRGDVIRLGP